MITTKDYTKRLQALEAIAKRHGRCFTALLTNGQSVKVNAVEAIMLARDSAAREITLDFMTRGCGQLAALMNDLIRG